MQLPDRFPVEHRSPHTTGFYHRSTKKANAENGPHAGDGPVLALAGLTR
jgi:hypothetical protein